MLTVRTSENTVRARARIQSLEPYSGLSHSIFLFVIPILCKVDNKKAG